MKVLLINDSTTDPNWGDRAAASSLKKMIHDAGGDIFHVVSEDDLRYSTFFERDVRDRAKQRIKLFVPPIALELRRKAMRQLDVPNEVHSPIPTKWDGYGPLAEALLRDRDRCSELLEAIQEADIAVVHGDGSMVGNGVVPRTELFLSYLVKKYFAKPVIIVNHTADFDHPDLLGIAQEVYPLFDDVVFRDPVSAKRCQTLCPGRFAADTAFLFEPLGREAWVPVARRASYFDVWPDRARFDPGRPYVCIGGSSKFDYETEPFPVRQGFTALIKHLKSVYDGQIVLTASDLTDQSVFRPIAELLDLPLVAVTIPVQQAVDIVGNADAYIGGRWHPSIFALRGGAPVVPISAKTFKMQALTSQAGLSPAAFDVFHLEQEKDSIASQLSQYLSQGPGLRTRLQTWAEDMCEKSWDNVAYLRKWSIALR